VVIVLNLYPEPRGPRVLPVGELVLWYGMFAPCGRLLGTMGFARGAPSIQFELMETSEEIYHEQHKRSGLAQVPERVPLV
jgi:hypothetical protein